MKRPVLTAVFLCAVAGLAGCPIYDHDSNGCYVDSDCAQSYVCDTQSGDCVLPSGYNCAKPSDCDSSSTCTSAGICVTGDCTFNGCLSGYVCDSSSGTWGCVPAGSVGTAGAAGADSGATDQAGQGGVGGQTAIAGQGGQSVSDPGVAGMSAGGVGG